MAGTLDLLYPPRCGVCDALGHHYLCSDCRARIALIDGSVCTRCGIPRAEAGVCGECRDQPRSFRAARSAGLYEGVLRTLILRFKYSPSRPLAAPLAGLLHECLLRRRALAADKIDCLIPVPVHPHRLRERDYNQSTELALILGRRMRIPVDTHSLRKTRETRPQMTLSARDRHLNLVGVFAVRDADSVSGKRILLIDDVMTTGATAQECSKVLVDAGAAEVRVLTLARETRTT